MDLHPDTVARLLVPGLSLAGCVQAHLWRDTTPAAHLSESQRTSWFPASPLCALSWTLDGDGWRVDDAGTLWPIPSRCMLGGPQTRPLQYRSTGGVRVFMTGLTPDALHALTGLDISTLTDRALPMDELLGPEWQALNRRMLAAADELECQRLLEDFLLPRWRARRMAAAPASRLYQDWKQHLALRAVAAGHGASLRQVERRIKQWSGQSLRALRGLSRADVAFRQVRRDGESGSLTWSVLAQDTGYADQAHLCRETRRVTGFSPEDLRRRLVEEEAFWAYRVWE